MNKTSFRFCFDETDDERDTVQNIEVNFESNTEFDDVLKKRLNTFLVAIGSELKVS